MAAAMFVYRPIRATILVYLSLSRVVLLVCAPLPRRPTFPRPAAPPVHLPRDNVPCVHRLQVRRSRVSGLASSFYIDPVRAHRHTNTPDRDPVRVSRAGASLGCHPRSANFEHSSRLLQSYPTFTLYFLILRLDRPSDIEYSQFEYNFGSNAYKIP